MTETWVATLRKTEQVLRSLAAVVLICVATRVMSVEEGGKLPQDNNPPQKGNLLHNPSFTGGLTHWTAGPCGDTPFAVPTIDRSVFRGSDMASLKIQAEPGKRTLLRQAGVPRDAGLRKYCFTVWTKSRGLSQDWIARVGIEQWKQNAYVRTLQNRHLPCGPNEDWALTRIDFEAPVETEQLAVYVGLWFSEHLKASPPKGGGAVWFDDVALEPVIAEEAKATLAAAPANGKIVVDSFSPLGERGLFLPGQPIQLSLSGKNNEATRAELEVEMKVTDFRDALVEQKTVRVAAEPSAELKQTIELAAPTKRGFFCVKATVKKDGLLIDAPSTGFCVVQPVEERDSFFGIDPNGLTDDLLKAFRIIGVGSLGIYQPWAVPKEELGNLKDYMRKQIETRWAPVWKSDFNIVGYVKIDPEFHPQWMKEETQSRKQRGLFPYPDALYTELGNAVEAEAMAMKDRVRQWIIQEEIDAWVGNPNAPAGSGTCELARHILMTRISYERLKKVDPNFLVAALGVCMDYATDPPYQLVRRILPELKNHFDLLAPDTYCGPYSLGEHRVIGPEQGKLREALLNTQKLQREWGKTNALMIAEKGLSVPYHLLPDHSLQKTFANLTARNLIVAKSVHPMVYYSLYLGVSNWLCYRIRQQGLLSTDERPIADFGIWKATCDAKGSLSYHPRAAVAAYATIASVLANTTDPVELNVRQGFYCYLFKKKDSAVATLWTIDKEPYSVRIELPTAAGCCDLMGNSRSLSAGVAELEVSESPMFLTCKSDPKVLSGAIQKAVFPSLSLVKCEAHLSDLSTLTLHLVNQTNQALEAEVEVDPLRHAKLPVRSKKATVEPAARAAVDFNLLGVNPAQLKDEALSAGIKVKDQVVKVTADLSVSTVLKVPEGMKVGGDLSKYAKVRPIVLDGLENLFPSRDVYAKREWVGPTDLSVRFYLAWDSTYFRIAARVTDDVHLQRQMGELIWMDDCVQFAFDTQNDALKPETTGSVGYDKDDYNYGIALTQNGPQCYCWVERGDTNNGGLRAFPLAIKRNGSETIYELAVPWEGLAPLKPRAGKVFGFSFIVFDGDTTENRQAAYWLGLTPGIANGQDPSCYRKFVLAPG